MFIYHFDDSCLVVDISFELEGATEKGGVDFEIGTEVPLHTCIGG